MKRKKARKATRTIDYPLLTMYEKPEKPDCITVEISPKVVGMPLLNLVRILGQSAADTLNMDEIDFWAAVINPRTSKIGNALPN
jgi:hypothetical protein